MTSSRRSDQAKAASDIRALTGLRGMAAVLVVLYHFLPSADLTSSGLKNSIGRGYLWVDLFFVLSGYVMALTYGGMFTRGVSGTAFADFLLRRIARIYPLYVTILAVQVLYTVIFYGDFRHTGVWAAVVVEHPVRDLSANFLLAQSLGVSHSIIGQAWSISTEFAAYFCFPALIALIIRGGGRTAMVLGALAILLLATVAAIDLHDGAYHSGSLDAYDSTRLTPLTRCVSEFLLGILAFRIAAMAVVTKIVSYDAVGLGVLALLVLLLAGGAADLMVVALFPPLVICLARDAGPAAAIFASPVMYTLGVWSYAIYLLHSLLQQPWQAADGMLAAHLPQGVATLLALAASLAVLLILARTAYTYIELPGRQGIRRMAAGMLPHGASEAKPSASC